MWRYSQTFILKSFLKKKLRPELMEGNGSKKRGARATVERRVSERQRVKEIKPISCDSFAFTWTAFDEYRGELTRSWTELMLPRVPSRECVCY